MKSATQCSRCHVPFSYEEGSVQGQEQGKDGTPRATPRTRVLSTVRQDHVHWSLPQLLFHEKTTETPLILSGT